MRNIIIVLITLMQGIVCGLSAQETDSVGTYRPGEGKSLVYIARRSGVGPLIKFRVYDGDTLLGKLGVNRFYAYECDPGHHIFAAKSENTSYVEAELESGKIYVLDVQGKMGIAYARVELLPLEKSRKNYEKERTRFLKFIANKKGEIISHAENSSSDNEDEGEEDGKIVKRFKELKEKCKKTGLMSSDMYFDFP